MKKGILSNDYALSVFSKIFTMVVGLLSSAFLTRYLGVLNKGDYAFVTQAVNVAVLVLNLGMYQSYSYNYRKQGDAIFQQYISLFGLQFVVYSLIAAAIAALSGDLLVCLIVFMTPIQILKVQMDNIMLVQHVKLRLLSNMLSSVLLMGSYAVLYFFFESALLPVAAVTVLIDLMIVAIYFGRMKALPRWRGIDRRMAKKILSFGFLPMLSALLVTLNYSVDIFFLKKLGDPVELSLYSVAAGIMNYVWLVPDAFKDIIFSRVARQKDKDANQSVAFSVKMSLVFLVIVTIGFVVVGRLFISLMYGPDFLGSYGVVLVLFLGVFSMIFFKIFGIVLMAEGRRVAHFAILLVSVILNVVLNAVLIPLYGMYGAAWASVGSYNLCGVLFLIYYARLKKIKIRTILLVNKEDVRMLKPSASRKNTGK